MTAPTPEQKTYTGADVQEAFERGIKRGEEDANERNYWQCKYAAVASRSVAQESERMAMRDQIAVSALVQLRRTSGHDVSLLEQEALVFGVNHAITMLGDEL